MSDVAGLQRALARICLERVPRDEDVAMLGGERALVYRELVRGRLRELISVALPRTERVLGREATSELFADFLAQVPPRSRYLREVIPAWVAFARPHLASAAFPAHAIDVLTLESTQWELGWREARIEADVVEFDLTRVPVPHPTLRVLELGHAVHLQKEDPPEPGRFGVCVHRRPDHVVETRTLDATGAHLVRAWSRADRTAIECVREVLREQGRAPDAAFVEWMASLLAALLERGAIIGSRA